MKICALLTGFAVALLLPTAACVAQSSKDSTPARERSQNGERQPTTSQRASAKTEKPVAGKTHKLAIQVDENKPEIMNLALNNAKNVAEYYKVKGEKVMIEIVTFGPGLHMLRDDTSPVKQRIAEMSLAEPRITFVACANTQANQSKQEQKPITLIPEAKLFPSGVVRLMELQGQGYAYVRP